jgi:hypothetical protein
VAVDGNEGRAGEVGAEVQHAAGRARRREYSL